MEPSVESDFPTLEQTLRFRASDLTRDLSSGYGPRLPMGVHVSFGKDVVRSEFESAKLENARRRLVAGLTAFELNTLRLFASGMHRRDIAGRLRRAPKTISNSLTVAKEKLGAQSLAEAAALLVEYSDSESVDA